MTTSYQLPARVAGQPRDIAASAPGFTIPGNKKQEFGIDRFPVLQAVQGRRLGDRPAAREVRRGGLS